MITDAHTLLEMYNSNTLWEMARHADLPGTIGKKLNKQNLLRLMQQEFFKPERIQASYQKLSRLSGGRLDLISP